MVVITLASIAGAALLLGTTTSLDMTDEAMQRTIAHGMAQQLMDEVLGCRYMMLGGNPYQYPFGPNATEAAGPRAYYDDIDDFNGLRFQPPADPYGIALGTDDGQGGQRKENFRCRADFFQNWRQEIDINYVSESNLNTNLSAGQTSDFRAVEVRIIYIDPQTGPRELAKLRRVVVYVAPLQIN
jgi:hypothetical protein